MSNTLLLTYISVWNGVGARLAEALPNIRMEDLKVGVTSDARISTWGSYVSNGAGGSCFGKDIQSLIYQMNHAGRSTDLLQAVHSINEYQKTYLIDRAIHEAQFSFNQKTVALLGLAFKKRTNDMRDSAALRVVESRLSRGVKTIRAYDPLAADEARRVVPAVHPPERPVVDGLQPVLDPDVRSSGIALEQPQDVLVHAVRPRADGEPDHVGLRQGLVVERPKTLDGRVGVREGLEVGDEFRRAPQVPVQGLPVRDLLRDCGQRSLLPETGAPPVAVRAAADGDRPVAVRAGEPRVDLQFVDPASEAIDEEALEIEVAFPGSPGCGFRHEGKSVVFLRGCYSVSYTPLTLPTIYSV